MNIKTQRQPRRYIKHWTMQPIGRHTQSLRVAHSCVYRPLLLIASGLKQKLACSPNVDLLDDHDVPCVGAVGILDILGRSDAPDVRVTVIARNAFDAPFA